MRRNTILGAAFSVLFLIGCGGKEKQKTGHSTVDKPEPGVHSFEGQFDSLGKFNQTGSDIEKIQQQLADKEPVSHGTLKKVIPKSLIGLERKGYSISSNTMMGGMLIGESEYENDSDRSLKFSIMDGAGKTSSSYVAAALLVLNSKLDRESQNGFTHTIDRDGHLIKVEQKTDSAQSVQSSYEFVVQNRFLINLEGRGVTADELKKVYNKLDFKALLE